MFWLEMEVGYQETCFKLFQFKDIDRTKNNLLINGEMSWNSFSTTLSEQH